MWVNGTAVHRLPVFQDIGSGNATQRWRSDFGVDSGLALSRLVVAA